MSSTRLMSPEWGWIRWHHIPFPRKENNLGFGSISQAGVCFWSLYFHSLSQHHGSCSKLPQFLPSTLCNTTHSGKEDYESMTHICFFSESRELRRMFKVLSISGHWGQVREQRLLCPFLPLQNLLAVSLDAKFEVVFADSKFPLWFLSTLFYFVRDWERGILRGSFHPLPTSRSAPAHF